MAHGPHGSHAPSNICQTIQGFEYRCRYQSPSASVRAA
jgi:hypothetical protein